jgi:hypothetical protein
MVWSFREERAMQQQVATTVEQLHALVDQLPQGMWDEAARYLTGLNTEDPVLRAFLLAPLDDEPLTDEEIALVEEGEAEIARGEGIPWEIVRDELASDVECPGE